MYFGLRGILCCRLMSNDYVSSMFGVVGWLLSPCDNPLPQGYHLCLQCRSN